MRVALLVLACCLLLAAPAAAADVNVCGTLRAFTPPTQSNNVGTATVGEKTWNLSGTPGPNNVSPQATVGSNVCLSGELAASQTTPDLLIRWSLVPNTAQSPSSTPATGGAASTLPSTATGAPSPGDASAWTVWALIAAAVLAALLLARLVTRRRAT